MIQIPIILAAMGLGSIYVIQNNKKYKAYNKEKENLLKKYEDRILATKVHYLNVEVGEYVIPINYSLPGTSRKNAVTLYLIDNGIYSINDINNIFGGSSEIKITNSDGKTVALYENYAKVSGIEQCFLQIGNSSFGSWQVSDENGRDLPDVFIDNLTEIIGEEAMDKFGFCNDISNYSSYCPEPLGSLYRKWLKLNGVSNNSLSANMITLYRNK